jgi:hypothetical protein
MLPACESPEPPYALSDNRRKPLGHESPIGPCIATLGVDNRQACCFRKPWAPSQQQMEPQEGRTASPLRTRRQRPFRLRKTTRSLGWAECRKKKGIEPRGSCFLWTFPLIGHVRFARRMGATMPWSWRLVSHVFDRRLLPRKGAQFTCDLAKSCPVG